MVFGVSAPPTRLAAALLALCVGAGCHMILPYEQTAPRRDGGGERDQGDGAPSGDAGPAPAACSVDRWCWENPLPQGTNLNRVWGSAPDDVVAVGDRGTILERRGGHWQLVTRPGEDDLRAVWASAAAGVFVVGPSGAVLRRSGGAWAERQVQGMPLMYGVWGASAQAVYAVGHGGAIYRFNGAKWGRMTSPVTSSLRDIHGCGPSEIYAVGDDGTVVRHDGTSWSEVNAPGSKRLTAVWCGGGTVHVAEQTGRVHRRDGSGWTVLREPEHSSVYYFDLWGRGPGDLWLVGSRVFHHDGSAWTEVIGSGSLRGVWGTPAGAVFIVGWRGAILERPAGAKGWQQLPAGPRPTLYAVGGRPTVFAGCSDGLIRRDADGWRELTGPWDGAGSVIRDIWTVDASLAYAVGRGGTVLRFDGERWGTMTAQTTEDLYGVWGTASEAYAVGKDGEILQLQGAIWRPLASPVSETLHAVWGPGNGTAHAVGAQETVVSCVKGVCSKVAQGGMYTLRGIWGVSAQEIYIVGGTTIRRFDGTTLTSINATAGTPLYAVYGLGPKQIYAVGGSGRVVSYDGASWREERTNTAHALRALWGSAALGLFAVGDGGTVLHKTP